MSGKLAGKVAIITGASSGIGRATAKVFTAEGASVTVTGRRGDRLSDLVNEIGPVQALSVPADITDRAAVDIMVAQTIATFGHVDILVNNAGVMLLSGVEELLVDEWDRMIDVNIKGLLYGVAAVLPHMRAQSSGHIINVDSVAGRRPFPTGTIYSATKFAVRCISAGLRNELSPTCGIRVTDIQPGIVDTELLDHVSDQSAVDAFHARWGDKVMLEADDVANAILYAASQPPRVNVNELLVRPTDQEG
jgi:NADP-dependent 3-hydroxy acid dehydrogenase YdfG